LSAIALDEESAKHIAAELKNYFWAPQNYYLVPPWHPAPGHSADDARRFALSRETFQKINSVWREVQNDPRLVESRKQSAAAFEMGERDEIRRIGKEMGKLSELLRQEALQRLKNTADGTVDVELVAAYMQA